MHPELLSFGSFTIHSYGFLIVVGFLLSLSLIRKKAADAGENPDHYTDLAFWGLLLGLAGGRTLYVITLWKDFAKNPIEIFKFWNGGLVFYGGLIAGILTTIYLSRKYKLPILKTLDIAAPSLALAHVFGRFGCFAAGCCYGKPIDPNHPFAIVFSGAKSIAPVGVPLHPAQLYDALNAFIIFIILEFIYKKKKFHGQVIIVYGVLYAIGRSIVEVYRGDKIRGFVIPDILSTSQFIALVIFSISAIAYIRISKRENKPNKSKKAR